MAALHEEAVASFAVSGDPAAAVAEDAGELSPGITWYSSTGTVERTLSGEVKILKIFFFVGCKNSNFKLGDVIGEPDRISQTTFRLRRKDGSYCDITCLNERAADAFEVEVHKKLVSLRPKAKPISTQSTFPVPSSAGPLLASCGYSPSTTPKPARVEEFEADEFTEFSSTNTLMGGHRSIKVGIGRTNNDSRFDARGDGRKHMIKVMMDAGKQRSPTPPTNTSISSSRLDVTPEDKIGHDSGKRRILDDLTLEQGTPAKAARSVSSYPVRAPPRAAGGILLTGRSGSAGVPVASASYNGYRLQSFGLRNLGNTCYLNAVMQALFAMREFVKDLSDMPRIIPPSAQGELFRCTSDIFGQMSAAGAGTGPLSPAKLRERIGRASPMFAGNEQQDAHEFFLEYVNQLHDELLEARSSHLPPEVVGDGAVAVTATQAHFDAEVVKKLVCPHCQHQREVHERFRDFSLDFAQPSTLRRMLAAYFDQEVVQVACEKCGQQEARMEKQLASSPEVLVLHLKRFVPNMETMRYEKLNQAVEFPAEFTLSEYIKPFGQDVPAAPRMPARPLSLAAKGDGCYQLRAAVAHQGPSPHAGHYVCYAKSGEKDGGVWRLYDDTMVRDLPRLPVEEMGTKAYILFYVRENAASR